MKRSPTSIVRREATTFARVSGAWRRRRTGFSASLILACMLCTARGQTPGMLDDTFETGSSVDGEVKAVAPAGNGKVYIGGDFSTVRGAMRARIARLHEDGTADKTFNGGAGPDGTVETLTVQTDGKVLIAGNFLTYQGVARSRIARLNPNGSLDTSFNPGTGAESLVKALAVQTDGKVLAGGFFTSFNGTARNGIARLNSDGSLDSSFNPGTGLNGSVYAVALQGDGKVLIGGSFTTYNGTARSCIARLNTDGSLDTSFDPSTGLNAEVYSVALNPDGKVILGGAFTSCNGTTRNHIAQLTRDGTLDTEFDPGDGTDDVVLSVASRADGKVLIGGRFTLVDGAARKHFAQLRESGKLDEAFDPGAGSNARVNSVATLPDGMAFIAGVFTTCSGEARTGVARLKDSGGADTAFEPGSGATGTVSSCTVQEDGKILVCGDFTHYHGVPRPRIARLHSNGSLDAGFVPGTGADFGIHALALQTDGKVLIAGDFSVFDGTPRNRIARLNSNGSLDTGFNPGSGANFQVYCIAVRPDGKLLIGGSFTNYNGTPRNRIARLHSDGSLDTEFNPATGASSSVYSVALLSDGKVLIGGDFSSYNGIARQSIARLNEDGSLDTSFNPGAGAAGGIHAIALEADGRILIGGSFLSYNGTTRRRIARLHSDGGLDADFDPGAGADLTVYSIVPQADGKVVIGGDFSSFGGSARNGIARLASDGGLDAGFDPGTGPGSASGSVIHSVVLQSDGKALICGGFSSYNGAPCHSLARLANGPAGQMISVPGTGRVQWLRGGAAPDFGQVRFEHSTDSLLWSELGAGAYVSGSWQLSGLTLPVTGYIRASGRASGGYRNSSSPLIRQVSAYSVPPDIGVEQPPGMPLTDNTATVSFLTPIGAATAAATFTVRHADGPSLAGLALTVTGPHAAEFAVDAAGFPVSLTAGASSTFTVTFNPAASGLRTAMLLIASNDPDENPFEVALAGQGLAFNEDTDGDGLNDASEFQMGALGFDWQTAQPALVNALFSHANGAGLFTPTQVQNMHVGTSLLARDAAAGQFTLKLRIEKSSDLAGFGPFPFTPAGTTINAAGEIEFRFTVPDDAAFFRLEPR